MEESGVGGDTNNSERTENLIKPKLKKQQQAALITACKRDRATASQREREQSVCVRERERARATHGRGAQACECKRDGSSKRAERHGERGAGAGGGGGNQLPSHMNYDKLLKQRVRASRQ